MTIVHQDDLPERMVMRQKMKMAHNLAEQAFLQVWKHAIESGNKLDKKITDDDLLAYLGTIISKLKEYMNDIK